MPSPRQTISYLTARFREAGIRPDVRHGQNFLIDLNLLDLLLNAADIQPTDVILEVGTGMGSLTARMAEKAAAVVTVEIDERMYALASEELTDYSNILMLQVDALKSKNHLEPEVIAVVKEQLEVDPARRFKLVANLPYNIATPILSNLLTCDVVPLSMTATIQKELAERMVAVPSTKDYSALSIWMQALCDIQIVRILPPQVFWPKPKVHSAIVHIIPSPEKRQRIPDLTFFHNFVRSLFLHRRKYLRGVLIVMLKDRVEKPIIDELLTAFQFPEDVRAEQLDVETILALSEAVKDLA
ncbi:MAG: ribosomal RNA small subunit methyltransferase A [Pirellulaceae bacterium]|nr:ribosomal RNA small subunit methyltransferase A [Pirellulaceae bacterium]